MSEVIEVEKLGKRYLISHKGYSSTSFREMITENTKKLLRGKLLKSSSKEEFWALKDVFFKINQGERIGIIGRNGAGKTTLLKLLSRITEPSEGKIKIMGRIASLLEVGTGFHPELTGRENISLNGAILGMTRSEINKKFDDIVSFSGVEKFIDTPVKRYSSGMYVRLAFSVAAHLEPDILLIDEVLAVGDIEFQKKSLGKMEEISTNEGRTIVFVSHNIQAIKNLCKRCIWIEDGKIKMDDHTDKVTYNYQNFQSSDSGVKVWDDKNIGDENNYVKMHSLKILNSENEIISKIMPEKHFFIELEYSVLKDMNIFQLGFRILADGGEIIFQSGDIDLSKNNILKRQVGRYKSVCEIPGFLLNEGFYSIALYGHIPNLQMLLDENNVLKFEILRGKNICGYGKQPGFIKPYLNWRIIQLK